MKYLIFDCGGVLVWPRLGEWNIPFGAFEILGKRAADLYSSKYLQAYRKAVHWLDEDQLVPDIEAERRLRREYIRTLDALMEWRLNPGEIARLTDDFTDNINRYGLFEDVAPWLKRWKPRYRLSMLSDAMPSLLNFMDQWKLLDALDAAVISTQIGATKPDPRMYAAILEKLGAAPGDCLFVDDRVDNLEGAVAAGMQAVQMARPAFLPQTLWDGPVVQSLEALNRLIEA
jgi:HAD superfamily hydrolase (TIGR01549 family)